MRDLAPLRELSLSECRLLAFALVAAPSLSLGLSIFGLSRMRDALGRLVRAPRVPSDTGERAEARARTVARVVDIAAAHGVVRVNCLGRSLLTWLILSRDGIETTMRIGVLREGESLRAHAWVEHGGRPVNDTADVASRFPPFDRDFTGPMSFAP